jgi:RHS repeat-associated protein
MYGTSQSWKQTFTIDRFGNRTFYTASGNTTTLPGGCSAAICNPTIDPSNNRYTSDQGYSYDAAGNVTANAAGQSFEYDAENHQTKVQVTSTSATIATYQYDGAGQRVKKIVGTEETTFIYDAMGKSVAEYTLNSTETPTVRTRYSTEDQLGSPRVITDAIGQVQERHDYHAYGEEAGSALSGVRTAAQKYAVGSALRDRFTGYERDDESGLDYAQARYYSSAHGRFTSVDPLTASATIKNPQTFNRYSYCLNSPYKFTDPLGLNYQMGGGVKDPLIDGEFDRRLSAAQAEMSNREAEYQASRPPEESEEEGDGDNADAQVHVDSITAVVFDRDVEENPVEATIATGTTVPSPDFDYAQARPNYTVDLSSNGSVVSGGVQIYLRVQVSLATSSDRTFASPPTPAPYSGTKTIELSKPHGNVSFNDISKVTHGPNADKTRAVLVAYIPIGASGNASARGTVNVSVTTFRTRAVDVMSRPGQIGLNTTTRQSTNFVVGVTYRPSAPR